MVEERSTILVIRFSALGDLALTIPVVKRFLDCYPEKKIIFLSDQNMAGLFEGIDRLVFIGVDLKGKQKGLFGIYRIFQLLKRNYSFDAIADLHGVIRSYLLTLLLRTLKKPLAVIDKGRFEKFALTRKENKIYRPLKHTTERYTAVFRELGFSFELPMPDPSQMRTNGTHKGSVIRIGFAPFAKHLPKMYVLDKMLEVISHFNKEGYELYFFGGGAVERAFIQEWERRFTYAKAFDRNSGWKGESEVIKSLHLMVTMDSANMHLASLMGVRVVSVWGATHPHAGFYGWGQDLLDAVQVSLPCRPCSVFGNRECWRGDHACMNQIEPSMIISRVEQAIS
jgi:ADP-heptose:LPS heptosyltransferase